MKNRNAYNHNSATMATSFSSIIFSIIASSHHWLHMGILLILGSSTNMMATMTGVIWLRRVMILATIITTIYSVYRLIKHRHMPIWFKAITIVSSLVSIGFIVYTINNYGW